MSEETLLSDLEKKRHTGAHILASAVAKHLEDEKVDVKFGIGPPIEHGFYYDFDLGERTLTDADFKGIEKAMKHIVKQNLPFEMREVSISQAREISAHQPYKLELINDFEAKGLSTVTYYSIGKFEDLCRGNHVDSTGKVGAFKIDKVAGAYWKGDEKNPMMQRVYVLMFDTQDELDAHIAMLEEAKKRDHRKLGKELDLFAFSDLIGPGLPLFTPRGTILRDELTRYVIELQEPLGYKNVDIPHLTNTELYKVSGHYDKYGEDLFKFNMGEREFAVKPMNCPHHTQIFDSRQRSYKELPIAYYNITKVYRNEQSGELAGLSRVLSITQDDGHVFCRPDQIQDEASKIYVMIKTFYATLGMNLQVRLSRRDPANPQKYLGDDALWNNAENSLKQVLSAAGISEFIDGPGEAAFYGPKLDFMIKDAIGREWQVATIQLDFNMPMRFNLSYVDEHNQKQHPVMIHRAILGSVERFMSIMIEHFGGNFPTWMSPEQVRILPISDNFLGYAQEVESALKVHGVRVEIDGRAESLGKKIREAEIWKVPYSLIIGEKEVASKTVTPRKRHVGDMPAVSAQEFTDMIIKEIKVRSL
ncbi:threonine--tRNA ligase [Candidatus Falkowbacteria bacterium]|nr:threonine--tRNA ligase [Candidatus Falkowbacteria bacterium]